MAPKSKKITLKTDPKTEVGNHPKIHQKWKPNGVQIEPKRHPKINDFLARFSDPSGNIDGTSTELRRNFDGTSRGTLSPADPPGRRHIIKDYCTIISKDGWLAGSNTPRAVGPANFSLFSLLFSFLFLSHFWEGF